MSDYITDPELLAQLNGASQEKKKEEYVEDEAVLAELNKGDGYIDDPELLKQLNASSGPVKPDEGAGPLGAVAPAMTGYGYAGPTGMKELGQAVKAGASPYMSAAGEGLKKTVDIYKARPIMAPLIDAAGVMTMGVPPIAAGQQAMGAYDKFNAIREGAQGAGSVLSQGAPTTSPVKGLPTTETKGPYADMKRIAPPDIKQKITDLYGMKTGGGGNNAVRSWLNSAEGKAAQAANPEFAAKAAEYLKVVPGYGQQAMKVVSPLLKGAARVAGPLGMAANLYEAAPYLEKAGPELSSGAAQNRMADAQRMMLSRPTPQPLTPQEASNLLQSDDARTINIYGGRASLEALVKSGVRQKAASRVLGPVAPGQ